MTWFASAPSNIALIKYMGKSDPNQNIPSNASLSYTLPDLESFVELEVDTQPRDSWEPLILPGTRGDFHLSEAAKERYLEHLAFLKQQAGYEGHFIVRSCNNFPMSSGLASSASSFAALTRCVSRAIAELQNREEPDNATLAHLSQRGSGSSCRSFFAPWALWASTEIRAVDLPYTDLIHHVIVISHEEKTVSSSEAHERVTSSPLFLGRPDRATKRLQQLLKALRAREWERAYHICWDEFQDLHALFSSAHDPFSYMTEESLNALHFLQQHWQTEKDGPIITMDAGPNIHLLFRPDQHDVAEYLKSVFLASHDVL